MTNYDTIRPVEMGAVAPANPKSAGLDENERLLREMRADKKERQKPKLLVIGHARHGKDTIGDMIKNTMGLDFTSSSEFVGRECVWPHWGKERYCSFEDMFEDRVNFRSTWANLILAYNTPDLSRTATEMLKNNDMYVGMRNKAELTTCKDNAVFDYIIWVDAKARLPMEGKESMQLVAADADLHIDNNGPEENLQPVIDNLQKRLHDEGFEVNYMPTTIKESDPDVRIIEVDREMVSSETYPWAKPSFRMLSEAEKWTNGDWIASAKNLEWEEMPIDATQVLDHGFFKVLEVMGSDTTICESARMSYGRGTKKVSNDPGLINYLVRNKHTSPLEMGEIRFHMRMPIFVMRQWVRHRTANLNEYSGRYSEMVRLFYVPEIEQICAQNKVNKQGSAKPLPPHEALLARESILDSSNFTFDRYEGLLGAGVSRETARIILPLNTYTEVVWKLDISNLIKFLWLRDDSHAQWEIRQYAILVSNTVSAYFPLVFAAYTEARNSENLSPEEINALVSGNFDDLSRSQSSRISDLRKQAIFNED